MQVVEKLILRAPFRNGTWFYFRGSAYRLSGLYFADFLIIDNFLCVTAQQKHDYRTYGQMDLTQFELEHLSHDLVKYADDKSNSSFFDDQAFLKMKSMIVNQATIDAMTAWFNTNLVVYGMRTVILIPALIAIWMALITLEMKGFQLNALVSIFLAGILLILVYLMTQTILHNTIKPRHCSDSFSKLLKKRVIQWLKLKGGGI